MRIYHELAHWWPLFSPPHHYVEEAADLLPLIRGGGTMLELGSGGGSLAFHFKREFTMTLTDRSAEMLGQNRRVNPECEHIQGDMRTLALGRQFDRVMIHDAIMYATHPDDVRATLRTAARHCRSGGSVLVVPDCVKETFEPSTEHGGEDGEDGRALRYMQWSWDPLPNDSTFDVAYAFLLREADGRVSVELDRHIEGCFRRADWLEWFAEAGIPARIYEDRWKRDVFVAPKA